jgi:hypothetical protein
MGVPVKPMNDIRQGISQVAGEVVGHLAGLFIHLSDEPILAVVRFRASCPVL